jgi:hypothetical protein
MEARVADSCSCSCCCWARARAEVPLPSAPGEVEAAARLAAASLQRAGDGMGGVGPCCWTALRQGWAWRPGPAPGSRSKQHAPAAVCGRRRRGRPLPPPTPPGPACRLAGGAAPLLLRPLQRLVEVQEGLDQRAARHLGLGDEPPHPLLQLLAPPVQQLLVVADLEGQPRRRLHAALAHELWELQLELQKGRGGGRGGRG